MFTNIGKKIKTLAKVVCWLGIIGSVIGGIETWAAIRDEIGIWFFLLIAVVGSVISWISSFFLYGFGELIDQTQQINSKVQSQQVTDEGKSISSDSHPKGQNSTSNLLDSGYKFGANENRANDWTCKKCGTKNKNTQPYCSNCWEYK